MARSDPPRLLFYFLHLLGVGHVYRAKRLIEGFSRHDIAVDIVYGGERIGETFAACAFGRNRRHFNRKIETRRTMNILRTIACHVVAAHIGEIQNHAAAKATAF